MSAEITVIKPIKDRVIVKCDCAPAVTSTLILIEDVPTKLNTGTIEAIGPDVKYYKVGDRVLFGAMGGVPVNIGTVYLDGVPIKANTLYMDEEDLFGTIE